MRQPKGWKPFVQSDNEFLLFALTCRDSGIAASRRLRIKDDVLGLNIDLAVSRRLLLYENRREELKAKNLSMEIADKISMLMTGERLIDDDEAAFARDDDPGQIVMM